MNWDKPISGGLEIGYHHRGTVIRLFRKIQSEQVLRVITQGRRPLRRFRSLGAVRGAPGNRRSYRDQALLTYNRD
jgi:hypothetical protein